MIFTSDTLVPADLIAGLVTAGFLASPAHEVRRTVLETFDGRLCRAGLRLELREDAGYELVLAGNDSAPARVATVGVPRLAADLPAGPFRSRLAVILGLRALVPTLTMTALETTARRRDRAGKARVSVIVHDRATVEGHGPIPSGWGAEVEEVAGHADDASEARRLLRRLGLRSSPGGLVDVAAAAAGVALGGFHVSPTVPLKGDEPALDAFRRLLANLAETVDATWQGSVDDVDPEYLHDLRVAVRRTRSMLSQGKGVLPAAVRRRYQEEFRWLGAVTGRSRDLDVNVIEWDAYVAPLGPEVSAALVPVLDHIVRQREVEHAAMAEALRSDRYRQLMDEWKAWLHGPTPDPDGPEATSPIGAVAARRTAEAQGRLVARGRTLAPTSPAEDLHELRKDAKKLRYVLECFGSLYPPGPRKAFVRILRVLQDNLGEHQDAEVHASELRAMPSQVRARGDFDPVTLVAMGQLTEQLERRRRAARDDFARRFAGYDSKGNRRRLQKLLGAAGGRR